MKRILLLGFILLSVGLSAQSEAEIEIVTLLARNRYEKVLKKIDSLQKRKDFSVGLSFYAGKASEGLLRYNKAYDYYMKWYRQDTMNWEAKVALARTAHLSGRNQEALRRYERLSYERPSDFSVNFQLGNIYQQNEQYMPALSLFNKLLKEDPENVVLLKKVAENYKELGMFLEALDCYRKAFYLVPQNTALAVKLVSLLLAHRESLPDYIANATTVLDTAQKYNPFSVPLRQSRGLLCYFAENYLPCETIFSQLLEEGNNGRINYKYLGLACYQLEKYALALPILQQADSLFRNKAGKRTDMEVAMKYGETLGRLGKLEEALQVFSELKQQLQPDKRLLSYFLSMQGTAYAYSSQNRKAEEYYWKAYKMYPGNIQTLVNYVNLNKEVMLEERVRAQLPEERKKELVYIHVLLLQILKDKTFNGKEALIASARDVVKHQLEEMFFKDEKTIILKDRDGKPHRFTVEVLRQLVDF